MHDLKQGRPWMYERDRGIERDGGGDEWNCFLHVLTYTVAPMYICV